MFLSIVEYRPNTNTAIVVKNRSCKEEVTYKRGRVKE
jgi:hypothetical protein